jgi:glycosyltransferase involved in cell wall biosynthesis
VDIKRFQPVVQPMPHQEVNGKFTLGFVGSLKVWHGTDILLKAFQLLLKHCPAYHLLIVGDGPQRNWIEEYVRDAHIGEKVTITGWVAYDKLPNLIQKMDITVAPYPSLDKFYFSPLKLFEYMAAGKPVVASRIGSIQRAIQDRVTGLLVRPGDSEDLVEKIEQLRSDMDFRKAIGSAAAQEAEHHTWEQNARRVVDFVNLFRKKK